MACTGVLLSSRRTATDVASLPGERQAKQGYDAHPTHTLSAVATEKTPEPTAEILTALAVPTRWEAYQVLRSFGDMKARQLGTLMRISEASALEHVRELARIGFTEPITDATNPRVEVWHAIPGGVRLGAYDPSAEWASVALAWLRVAVNAQADLLRRWPEVAFTWTAEWLAASEVYDYTMHMTVDELQQLADEFQELMGRWRQRTGDPSREGVQAVWIATNAFPYPREPL